MRHFRCTGTCAIFLAQVQRQRGPSEDVARSQCNPYGRFLGFGFKDIRNPVCTPRGGRSHTLHPSVRRALMPGCSSCFETAGLFHSCAVAGIGARFHPLLGVSAILLGLRY
ncbi:hypothetical protein NDU88_004488 [Pleurodeles waltl]|uniref:Uncharacterized protein n=1 Tax=Pleurodeles waltl TaxID=8319 RepID=A0AAV7MTL5_PLEWA|nr:hypothetical protein NDU88_004488 [Pleurodeles waltl]